MKSNHIYVKRKIFNKQKRKEKLFIMKELKIEMYIVSIIIQNNIYKNTNLIKLTIKIFLFGLEDVIMKQEDQINQFVQLIKKLMTG